MPLEREKYRDFADWQRFASACGYHEVQQINDDRWVGLEKFMFNWAIIVGLIGDEVGYEDRWDLTNYSTASKALEEWKARNFDGEPDYWIRHLRSGRRRPDGTKESEEYRP